MINNQMFPARYEFRKNEATGTTALSPAVQLTSNDNSYGRNVSMQIIAYKNEEKDRNSKQSTIPSAMYTDRKRGSSTQSRAYRMAEQW